MCKVYVQVIAIDSATNVAKLGQNYAVANLKICYYRTISLQLNTECFHILESVYNVLRSYSYSESSCSESPLSTLWVYHAYFFNFSGVYVRILSYYYVLSHIHG